jgi:hypothetical protein
MVFHPFLFLAQKLDLDFETKKLLKRITESVGIEFSHFFTFNGTI